jgi:hypothetical protein
MNNFFNTKAIATLGAGSFGGYYLYNNMKNKKKLSKSMGTSNKDNNDLRSKPINSRHPDSGK